MKKNWVKWLVIGACIVTILASTTSAIANVKSLFGKKDDNKTPEDSTKTAAVLIDESLAA